ncbi:ribose-5-phosphate isomerase rki1 [Cadophora gregata f. sp. sojae]|nr:ribose-5-phosphate isomerase rki1 [Cadophora gregata f. sp. sojae]
MDTSLRRILLRGRPRPKHHTTTTTTFWPTFQFSSPAQSLARHYSATRLNVICPNYSFAALLRLRQSPKSPRTSYLSSYQKSSEGLLFNKVNSSLISVGRINHTMAASGPVPENATPAAQEVKPLTGVEASKRLAAYRAVEDHFDPSYSYIGIGSGSTVVYVVEAIAAKGRDVTSRMTFVPTGEQSKQLIIEAGLPLGTLHVATGLQDLGLRGKRQSIDVAFDGADEIDEELNCIKGGGACLFQEKLVATAAKKFICVADYRKLSPRLLTAWKAIPIEISPMAAPTIKRILITLGSPDPRIRQGGSAKAGPVVTDNGMWIMDAPFPKLLLHSDLQPHDHGDGEHGTWEVHNLGRRLKRIVGVLEVGLFHGRNGIQVASAGEEGGGQKPIAAYFGMEDGSVEVREAKEVHAVKSRP